MAKKSFIPKSVEAIKRLTILLVSTKWFTQAKFARCADVGKTIRLGVGLIFSAVLPQRGCVIQPRVASRRAGREATLGTLDRMKQPQRGCGVFPGKPRPDETPLGFWSFLTLSQGSLVDSATLGFAAEHLWCSAPSTDKDPFSIPAFCNP